MEIIVFGLLTLLVANAVVAFAMAFYWQAKVMLRLYAVSDPRIAAPWNGLGKPNSAQNTFGRFIAGEIFPELRSKWLSAIKYVAVSYLVLFAVGGLAILVAPEMLN